MIIPGAPNEENLFTLDDSWLCVYESDGTSYVHDLELLAYMDNENICVATVQNQFMFEITMWNTVYHVHFAFKN